LNQEIRSQTRRGENRGNGIFEIEAKGAMASAERVGQEAGFKQKLDTGLPAFVLERNAPIT
jgi:hypothetical protein